MAQPCALGLVSITVRRTIEVTDHKAEDFRLRMLEMEKMKAQADLDQAIAKVDQLQRTLEIVTARYFRAEREHNERKATK